MERQLARKQKQSCEHVEASEGGTGPGSVSRKDSVYSWQQGLGATVPSHMKPTGLIKLRPSLLSHPRDQISRNRKPATQS